MLNVVLPWIAAVVIIAVMAVVFRFFADDNPRSDDPPDTGGEPVTALPAARPLRCLL